MKHLARLTALTLATGLAGPAVAFQISGNLPPTLTNGEPVCETMARATLTAARSNVETAFWMNLANLINDPDCDLPACVKEAWAARSAAIVLAEEQYAARLVVCAALGHGAYAPRPRPADFTADVTNPLHPLYVGRTFVYESQTVEGLEHIEMTVTDQVTEIAGIPCRTVSTVESLDGVLKEHTMDWYSQHADGTVWYFGEVSQQYQDGILTSLDGSWRTGSENAKPGILMLGAPLAGEVYRMEFLLGTAEDVSRVVATDVTVTVAAGTFDGCVAIEEWSPLETADIVTKYYAPRFGLVLEVGQLTGERLELIDVR
jgi:hypothetical protein